MNNVLKEDKISGKSLILTSILPFIGILVMVKSIKNYQSGVSFAKQFEQDFSSGFGINIPNESHITGLVIESFDDLGLFNPFFGMFISLGIVSLYMYVLIKYFKQKTAIND